MSKARSEIMLLCIYVCVCVRACRLGRACVPPVLACVCVALQPKSALGRLFLEATHPVGLLWTSDQPVAEASTYTKHDKHKETNINTNQISSNYMSTPYTTRLPGLAIYTYILLHICVCKLHTHTHTHTHTHKCIEAHVWKQRSRSFYVKCYCLLIFHCRVREIPK
jgi:hypothetical protein